MSDKLKDDFYEHKQKDSPIKVWTKDKSLEKESESLTRPLWDKILTIKAEDRQDECWCFGCAHKATVWVREIQFDMKGEKGSINQEIVSTKDYQGPIPGFCFGHIAQGPAELAQAVYFDRMEMHFGLRPNKWWVIFTDGTKQGGLCSEINPRNDAPVITDIHVQSGN